MIATSAGRVRWSGSTDKQGYCPSVCESGQTSPGEGLHSPLG
ncbi:MAG: hypothetical protein ABWU17_09825 [Schleiferia thermophila]